MLEMLAYTTESYFLIYLNIFHAADMLYTYNYSAEELCAKWILMYIICEILVWIYTTKNKINTNTNVRI